VGNAIQKIAIVGHGNVGHHLTQHLFNAGIEITHIVGREKQKAQELADLVNAIATDDFEDLDNDQLVLFCVPDDAIAKLIDKIDTRCPIAYTSGSIELSSLPQRKELGVFYPLQTFTKGHEIDLFEVPFFIEATNDYFATRLFDLAWKISKSVAYASSKQRKELHHTAVWVNNFTNHIMYLAQDYAANHNIKFDHLKPLLKETMNKLNFQSPRDAQTGPARRGDEKIIEQHIDKLEGLPKEIYALISKSIQQTYSNND